MCRDVMKLVALLIAATSALGLQVPLVPSSRLTSHTRFWPRSREVAVARRAWQDPRFDGRSSKPFGGGFNLVPVALVSVLIFFPGFVFSVINVFLLALLVLPPLASFGLQQWSKRNLTTGPCPRCTAPISSLKDTPTVCFNCGAQLVPTTIGDAWRLRSVYDDDVGGSSPSSPFSPSSPQRKSSVIDVEADVE